MKDLILAQGGQSRYCIRTAGCDFAAGELQSYLQQISGALLPLSDGRPALCLEVAGSPEQAHARRNAEGYDVFIRGEDIVIRGEGPRGVIYGVYSLLEEVFGCRFFAENCERIPTADTLSVPGDLCLSARPKFAYRDVFIASMSPACKVKNKVNASLPADTPGGQFFFAGGFAHTIAALSEQKLAIGQQPCLTDETVFATVLKNCRKWLDENPDAAVISITQNDSYPDQIGCTCPRCAEIDGREGSYAGTLITFVNRIAEELEKTHPDVLVDTFAYRYTRRAPRFVRPRHNVVIRFCTIESCFMHPISHACIASEDSVYGTCSLVEDLRAWAGISHHLSIWDYCTNFSRYLLPFPDIFVLRDNVRLFLECNAIGVFEEGDYQNKVDGELNALRAYLLAKLLWEPDMSEETFNYHLTDFLGGYYGKAAPLMERYVRSVHERAARSHAGIYSKPETTFGYDRHDLASCNEFRALYAQWCALFAQAEALVADDEAVLARVRNAALSLKALKLNSPGVLSFLPETVARETQLYPDMRKAGIGFYREGGPV